MTTRVDTGSHYRYGHKVAITQEDIERGYVEVKLDPYRICAIYQTGGGPREHIVKKALRGTRKGATEQQLVNELRDALDRWQQLIDEDNALAKAITPISPVPTVGPEVPSDRDPDIPPLKAGYERSWRRCKRCGLVAYRDFVPYSLSIPVIVTQCGHDWNTDFVEIHHMDAEERIWEQASDQQTP